MAQWIYYKVCFLFFGNMCLGIRCLEGAVCLDASSEIKGTSHSLSGHIRGNVSFTKLHIIWNSFYSTKNNGINTQHAPTLVLLSSQELKVKEKSKRVSTKYFSLRSRLNCNWRHTHTSFTTEAHVGSFVCVFVYLSECVCMCVYVTCYMCSLCFITQTVFWLTLYNFVWKCDAFFWRIMSFFTVTLFCTFTQHISTNVKPAHNAHLTCTLLCTLKCLKWQIVQEQHGCTASLYNYVYIHINTNINQQTKVKIYW